MGKRPRLSNLKEEQKPSDYPGYPYYVSSEEVTKQNESVEETPLSTENEDDLTPKEAVIGSPSENTNDVSEEDLAALGPEDLSMDGGDDEQLAHRTEPVDFAGKDLDVPGSELDDESETVGSEDEENNSYSLGGDDHNDLEESKP
jgi:hypothetical protein